jgi:serine/threonine protein kinase
VSHHTTGITYALKAVSKYEIVQTGQEQHIMSEKKCMELFDHPFLVKLFATYKDSDRLYFLLEPCLGGDLFNVLRKKGTLDEKDARFYAASVVLAFEYMHSFDIIYRDLKPENLLLNNEGFLKVTDFGFARHIVKRTFTLCGTPDYLAPEIVAGRGHGKGVDWWTLGVFIFEMLASYPPFYDDDPMQTYDNILHKNFSVPMHFSKDAVALVTRLLQRKPTKRLGVLKGGAKLIKKHPWFSSFNFDALVNLKMKTPFVPTVKNQHDISNFPEYPDMKDDSVPVYVDNGTNWDADF